MKELNVMAFHAAFTAVMAVALCRLPQACLQVEARHGTDEGEAGGGDRHTDTQAHRHTDTHRHTCAMAVCNALPLPLLFFLLLPYEPPNSVSKCDTFFSISVTNTPS